MLKLHVKKMFFLSIKNYFSDNIRRLDNYYEDKKNAFHYEMHLSI